MHDMLILWRADIPKNVIDILQPHTFNPADPQRIIIPFVALITLHIQCLCHVHDTCHVSCFEAWTTLIALIRFNAFVAFMPLILWTSSRTAVTSSLHCFVACDPPSMSNAEASHDWMISPLLQQHRQQQPLHPTRRGQLQDSSLHSSHPPQVQGPMPGIRLCLAPASPLGGRWVILPWALPLLHPSASRSFCVMREHCAYRQTWQLSAKSLSRYGMGATWPSDFMC
jgi:hypothetical protein